MKLIKLNAIDSTNDFLKEMSRNQMVENFTTVVTLNQTKGKGQMGSVWDSETAKNLTMSILVKDCLVDVAEIFHLNVAVSISIFEVLNEMQIPDLSIKWPNDIMSDVKKIGGILIENSFKSDGRIESIVGIGLNVNQRSFSGLPKASSLSIIMQKEYNLDLLLDKIVLKIKQNCELIFLKQSDILWKNYHNSLFKIGLPMPFEGVSKNQFMGIIQQVTFDGKLELILEDDSVKSFGIKEIQMLY